MKKQGASLGNDVTFGEATTVLSLGD